MRGDFLFNESLAMLPRLSSIIFEFLERFNYLIDELDSLILMALCGWCNLLALSVSEARLTAELIIVLLVLFGTGDLESIWYIMLGEPWPRASLFRVYAEVIAGISG